MEEVREPYNKLQLTAKLNNVLSRHLKMKCVLWCFHSFSSHRHCCVRGAWSWAAYWTVPL